LARGTVWLFAAVMLLCSSAAAADLSGYWMIDYKVLGGSAEERTISFAEGGMLQIIEDESTLHGSSSLGSRGDGFLIGAATALQFDAAITFRSDPLLFLRLNGERSGDALSGKFTASSSDGRFWWGDFLALPPSPNRAADGRRYSEPDAGLSPQPLRFVDPEAFWSNQTGKEHREIFTITYDPNTILMCRNVPMIWQWWM